VTADAIHNFKIPHDKFYACGDTVVVRVPSSPDKLGSFWLPDQFRDMNQSNVMCGKVFKMGAVAFLRKDADGSINREPIDEGDWVLFRPHAGTYIMNGKVTDAAGWRYLSSHKDVLGFIKAGDMPEAADMSLNLEMEKARENA
jgi:hypothetical protein